MILQLNPAIPVTTPKGKGIAHAIIDYGIENDLKWICFQDSTGECWTWNNTEIRAQINITHGRNYISPFYHPSAVAFSKDREKEDNEKVKDEELEEEKSYKAIYSDFYINPDPTKE